MEVIKYLQSGKTLEDLELEYHIEAKIGKNGVVSLNYNQIYSDMSLPICRECRSLILELGTWNLVARSFYKFFNAGESKGADIEQNFDWNSMQCLSKIDGSLILLYFYNNQWWFSTRSMPCAEGPLNTEMTFRDLISLTIQKMGYKDDEEFFQQFNSEYSYSFELTTPYNEVVVPQKECKLTLIGAWNVSTLEEINIHKLKLTVPIVEEYQITSLEACVRFVEEIQAHQGEGVVVKDKFGNRLKIKSPSYLAAHRAISISSTPRNQMELILSNAVDDVYTLLPDIIQESIDELKTKLNKLVDMTVKDYNEVKHHEVQKDFALAIVGKKLWTGALFNLRKGKTMDEIVHSTNIDTLLDLMKKV